MVSVCILVFCFGPRLSFAVRLHVIVGFSFSLCPSLRLNLSLSLCLELSCVYVQPPLRKENLISKNTSQVRAYLQAALKGKHVAARCWLRAWRQPSGLVCHSPGLSANIVPIS